MTATREQPLPIAVLISGGGTTLRNLIERQQSGKLAVNIRAVVSSNPGAAGLRFASQAKIPSYVEQRSQFADAVQFSHAIFEHCRAAKVDLVVMGGFLKHVIIPSDFVGRVMNIHPSLIPAFSGAGYYGRRVHQAVLDHGVRYSGCTVHFVDDQYDHGPIILQRVVEVRPDDTPDTLAARVFREECEALPEAIELYAAGRLRIDGQRVSIVSTF